MSALLFYFAFTVKYIMAIDKILENKILQDIEALIPIEERWENLTLANDFMFRAVMSDEKLCTEMMRRILPDIEINYISIPEAQKSIKETLGTRGVRFDLYAKSDNGKIYDIEIQTTDNKDLARRSRAYQLSMGLDVLNRDRSRSKKDLKHYKNIPDSYVIFICMFDPFKMGRHIYTFKNICTEAKSLAFDDGAFTIFLNAEGKADDVNPKLRAFLDFLTGKETPGDEYINELARRLAISKASIEWRRIYMYDWIFESSKLEDAREEAAAKARAEATAEATDRSSAIWIESLKNLGLAEDVIANLAASVNIKLQSQSTTGA